MQRAFVVGLTGGIAGGKTAVSNILEEMGACVIDADVISREVIAPDTEGERQLKSRFPHAFKDGTLDRATLRETVFADKAELNALNAITHPLIMGETVRRIDACERDVVFLVVPLMFEAGFDKLCDYIVTVSANEKVRISRLMMRNNNITEQLAREMIAAQTDDEQRARLSDEVISNDGSYEELAARARELYRKICTMERTYRTEK